MWPNIVRDEEVPLLITNQLIFSDWDSALMTYLLTISTQIPTSVYQWNEVFPFLLSHSRDSTPAREDTGHNQILALSQHMIYSLPWDLVLCFLHRFVPPIFLSLPSTADFLEGQLHL